MKIRKRVLILLLGIPLVVLWLLFRLGIGLGTSQPPPPEFIFYAQRPKPAVEGSIPPRNWNAPAAVAAIGNRLFVLDTGNDRILELNNAGEVTAVLCETGDCQFLLKNAQALTIHNDELYVANTGAGQVVVLSVSGSVLDAIDILVPRSSESEKVSPAGIAVSPKGDIYVADTNGNLVLRLRRDNRVPTVLLEGRTQEEKYRPNAPMGLAIDARDNLYVANSGNGLIRMYSPEGRHLQEFAMRSSPTFFSPAYLAIDPSGDVYFTDNRSRMVFVYDPAGDLVGTVGLLDARRVDSPGVLRDPQGLYWADGTLYVADRTAGVLGFQIDPEYWRTRKPSKGWSHP